MRIIGKIKFSKTEKTSNLEAAKLKLHTFLKMKIKIKPAFTLLFYMRFLFSLS